MKKYIAGLLSGALCLFTLTGAAAAIFTMGDLMPAEETTSVPRTEYNTIAVGVTTKATGDFFTNMWGNNTTDIDVRSLVHGYSPVVWTEQTTYQINEEVVKGITIGEYQDDGKMFLISIYADLTYNDGSPITSADYAFSLLLQAHPALRAIGANTSGVNYLKGYDDFAEGKTDFLSGVKIIDDHNFTIEVSADYLPFFYELGLLDFSPYPISVIAPGCEVVDTGEGAFIRNIDTTVAEPIFTASLLRETILNPETGYLSHPRLTCGPYMLTSYDAASGEARFVRNPFFRGTYDRARPSIENLILRHYPDSALIAAYEAEEIQVMHKLVTGSTIDAARALTATGTAYSANYARIGLGFLSFACEDGPFQSKAVRQAVAYALDTESLCASLSSYAVPIHGYMGLGQWMYQLVAAENAPVFASSEDDIADWEALTLDGLNPYAFDLEKAEALLEQDGWVLNERGDPYTKGTDPLRFKDVDGTLTALRIRWGCTIASETAALIADALPDRLASIGFAVETVDASFDAVLKDYYRKGDERQFDMHCLATNFLSSFDPYLTFHIGEQYQQVYNTTGIQDADLEALAYEMRSTLPGDLLDYAQCWLRFQERFNEVIPMLPLYSNVYFDFFVPELSNYHPGVYSNWPTAIVYAYTTLDKPEWLIQQEEAEMDESVLDDDEVMMFDF